MNEIKIAVIIPCYNQAKYLEEALNSVLKQTHTNWQCLIINDGSNDNTEEISKEWVLRDKRFNYLFQINKGISNARNYGISSCSADYILPLDADDKISKNYLELAEKEFSQDSNLKLVYCNAEKFGKVTGFWNLPSFSLPNLAKENLIFSSALFKKEDWKRIDGYDEKMRDGWEDWEFWISLLKDGGKVKKIEETCFYYRIRDNSRNLKIKENEEMELYYYLSLKHTSFFIKHIGTFHSLNKTIANLKYYHEEKLKSEKFVLDLFFKRFFGFTIFGKYKKN